MDISQIPAIQHIVIAGIQASIPFHHQVVPAGAGGGAGAGRHTQKMSQIILEIADVDIISLFPVPIPAVEDLA